ncbi:hypothetical protein ACWEWU_09545 [Staphylococcus xylosus]
MAIKLGETNIPFVYQGSSLLFPAPINTGLLFWCDFMGITNNSKSKASVTNLVNNSNNSTLQNFAFNNLSGYDSGLVFDGIDDFVSIDEITRESFTNDKQFTFDMTLTLSNANKKGTLLNLPLSSPRDGSKRLLVKLTENNEMTIGKYNGTWYVRKTPLLEIEKKINVVITFSDYENSNNSFDAYIHINGEKHTFIKEKQLPIDGYGSPHKNLIIGWHVARTLEEYSYLKGKLHSLKIYNRNLSESEIQHNFKIEKNRWGIA